MADQDGTIDSRSPHFYWNIIDRHLQGDRPNRWIPLPEAVQHVAKKLNVLPGVAQGLLQKEALPPDVPWVGDMMYPGNKSSGMTLISAAEVKEAKVNFFVGGMTWPTSKNFTMETFIELNHLDAWLEKRKAPVTQRETSPPPKGEVDELKWSEKRPERKAAIKVRDERRATRAHQLFGENPARTRSRLAAIIAKEDGAVPETVRRYLPSLADLKAQLAKK